MSDININNRKYQNYPKHLVVADTNVFDPFYGPWNSWPEMANTLNGVDDFTQDEVEEFKQSLGVGVTVGIYEGGKVVEYWKPSINGSFVVKSPDVEVSDSDIAEAVSDYFAENPPTGVSDEKIVDAVNDYLDAHPSTLTENDVKDIVEENLFTGEGDKKISIYVPSKDIDGIISSYLYDEEDEVYIQKSKISDASINRLKYYGPWESWEDFVKGVYNGIGDPYDKARPGYVNDDTVTKKFLSNISSVVTVVIDGVEYWKPMDKDSVTGSYPQGGDDFGGFVPKQSDTKFGYFVDDSDSDPYDDEYVDGAVRFSDFVEREKVIAESLNDLNERIKDTDVSELSKRIEDVAEVSASSIISLDTRIDKLEETLVKSVDKDGAGLLFYLVA